MTSHHLNCPFCNTAVYDLYSLQDGKPKHIWEYEQKMKALEEDEQTRMGVLQAQRESLMEEQGVVEQAVMETVPDPGAPLQQEVRWKNLWQTLNLQYVSCH